MSLTSCYQDINKHTILCYVLLEMDFSLYFTFEALPSIPDYYEKSILAKQINDSIYRGTCAIRHPVTSDKKLWS